MKALTTTLTANGDLPLPKEVQEALGVGRNSKVVMLIDNGRVTLHPLLAESLADLRGIFASDRDLVAELQQERRQDKW